MNKQAAILLEAMDTTQIQFLLDTYPDLKRDIEGTDGFKERFEAKRLAEKIANSDDVWQFCDDLFCYCHISDFRHYITVVESVEEIIDMYKETGTYDHCPEVEKVIDLYRKMKENRHDI